VYVRRRRKTLITIIALLLLTALTAAPLSSPAGNDQANTRAITDVRIGIDGHVKVGRWAQVQVELDAGTTSQDAHITVTAPDNDGVPTHATMPLSMPPASSAGRVRTTYTNVGRLRASIDVALAEGATTIETRTLEARDSSGSSSFVALPATAELLLHLGPTSSEQLDIHTDHDGGNGRLRRKAVRAETVDALPRQWFGYDAVDLAILTVGDGGPSDVFCKTLAADEEHFNAFVRWIELGGRLVIFTGGENAQEMLGAGQPLAALLPGKLSGVMRLPETGRLENFAGSEAPIGGRGTRQAIPVPRLVDVEGRIEVYEGRRPSDLPLVVRAPRGLGEIAFVAVDPSQPPFSEWPGRKQFIDAVLRPYLNADHADGSQKLVTRGYNDLSGALRQNLGRTFTGVVPIGFSLVAVLALAYLLVLGPLDYFFIQRWSKQSWLAWLTFPAIVLVFGGLALGLAERRHGGNARRINQVELVDVDAISGQARGTVWSAVYSPRADRLDLRLDVKLLSDKNNSAEARIHSWALTGSGIGGTQSGGESLATAEGYRYADDFDALIGVPILTAGSKSLLGRWTAPVGPLVLADLRDEDGLVTGSIENRTGRRLRNVRLYHGEWGYRLGTLAEGARVDVGEQLRPVGLRTIVTQDSLAAAALERHEENVFVADRASLKELLNTMMFYEAVGGFGFAQLPNRFQAYCDLSRLPMLGRAVLVDDVATTGSQLVDADGDKPIGDQDSTAVIYRFVFPVRDASAQ
jgi:hypothetical protein